MIRRSTAIATVAIALSLLVHFLGLGFTSRGLPERSDDTAKTDVVALGNAFEDVAETLPEPVEPEETPPPEPPQEAVPEPEVVEPLTSEVLVASSNPQRTNSPDTGTARIVPPDTAGQSKPTEGQVPEPETVKPSGGDEGTSPEVTTAPRVDPDTTTQAPKGNPDARVEPVEAETTTPAPQRLAALPVPVTPGVPVAPSPEPPVIPVVPLESETLAPQTPEATLVPAPEDTETVQVEDDAVGSDLAVAVSPRPPTAPRRSTTEPLGLRDGSTDFSELQFPPLMESPLVTYQRGQTDLVIRQNGGVQSGGLGFVDSRGPGNSDVTNYAGRVLVHLNRSPPVRLSARGAARILFEINPDGTLGRIDIIDSTGSKEIERAARLQVQNAAPFPLPPQGASRRVTFVYWNN